MKNKTFNTFLLLSAFCLLLINVSFAQSKFKKYRSKTNFNTPEAETNSKGNNKSSSKDVFGRNKNNSNLAPKAKEYVNLNPETAFGPEVITSFNFPNTSLTDLTKHMQKLTGMNLILDKELKGKISIMAPTPITVGDAWKAYLTALNINGYTLVKSGAFYNIVTTRDIRYTPTKIYTGHFTPDTDNYAMKIIPLKHIESSEVTRSFRPFMSRYGRIIEIKQTNTVIVQDAGTNINRLDRLIKFIDVPGHEMTLQIIPVKHSSAQEIAKLIEQIIKTDGKSSRLSRKSTSKGSNDIGKLIFENRTNSIIAMANAVGARQLRQLIRRLDVNLVSSSSGQIHVYYLNHGDAETLAKTLSGLVSGVAPKGNKSSRFSKSTNDETLFNGPVKLTADKDNNALVVTASPTDYLTIKSVIKKLDIARDQVYVEGLIMETKISKQNGYGLSIIGSYGKGAAEKAGFLGGSSDLLGVLGNDFTNINGIFAGGGLGGQLDFQTPAGTTIKINNINALISAFATDSNTNVLATPQLLVMDNTEGVFEVGDKIPNPKQTNAASGATSFEIQQQTVALTLKITPHINKVTRFIKLDIDQQIEDFSNISLPAGLQNQGMAVSTRKTVTSVTVRDRDTIAMGGLMRDKKTDTINKVPLLGDIPILGWLFKHKKSTTEKVNLLFFLTPKILSPYEGNTARAVKDNLNRRSSHLKTVFGDDDPFGNEAKALYEKAKLQEKEPLYDKDASKRFRDENNIYQDRNAMEERKKETEKKIRAKKLEEELKRAEEENKKLLENKNENVQNEDDSDNNPILDDEALPLDEGTTENDVEFELDNEQVQNIESPNYKKIIQDVKLKESSIKRN